MRINFDSISMYELWLALKITSAMRFNELIAKYGSAEAVFDNFHSIKKYDEKLISDTAYKAMCDESPEKLYLTMRPTVMRLEIDVILKSDPLYPPLLKQCVDSPEVLFVRGTLPSRGAHTVGIVGTRNYTSYGAEITDTYAYDTGRNGGVVVSGLALGIDSVASKSALRASEQNCATVAVLGSGVDIPTPVENERLYERVIEQGAVVSQFALGAHATRYSYPMRNKVIAGISEILLVTEAGEKSGALITAEAAIKYGRKVFCVPGRVSDKSYAGSNKLLDSGKAMYVPAVENFFESAFSKKTGGAKQEKSRERRITARESDEIIKDTEEKTPTGLDEAGEKIYNALKQGNKNFDELCAITGYSVGELNLSLTLMEFSEIIIQLPGRVYKLR